MIVFGSPELAAGRLHQARRRARRCVRGGWASSAWPTLALRWKSRRTCRCASRKWGPLPADEACALFARSRAGFFTYPVPYLAKSTIFAGLLRGRSGARHAFRQPPSVRGRAARGENTISSRRTTLPIGKIPARSPRRRTPGTANTGWPSTREKSGEQNAEAKLSGPECDLLSAPLPFCLLRCFLSAFSSPTTTPGRSRWLACAPTRAAARRPARPHRPARRLLTAPAARRDRRRTGRRDHPQRGQSRLFRQPEQRRARRQHRPRPDLRRRRLPAPTLL